MNIYTSYFSHASSLDSSRFFVVSISRFSPRGFHGFECLEFAPPADLLRSFKRGLSERDYSRLYREWVLECCDVRRVFVDIAKVCGGRDIVLCCYERPDSFCHRHLLSDYVFEKYGYRIQELS